MMREAAPPGGPGARRLAKRILLVVAVAALFGAGVIVRRGWEAWTNRTVAVDLPLDGLHAASAGARVIVTREGAKILGVPDPWAYAAALDLDPPALQLPHARLTVDYRVLVGEASIGVLNSDEDAFTYHAPLRRRHKSVTLDLPPPDERGRLIIRNRGQGGTAPELVITRLLVTPYVPETRPVLRRSRKHPNVLLVSFDTLRADYLGSYGAKSAVTPNLDRFSSSAVLFERAYCAVPFTVPSLWSLQRSIHIHEYTYDTVMKSEWPATSIAEVAQKNGYLTAGFTGHPSLNRGMGYEDGFDFYFDTGNNELTQHNDYVVERMVRFIDDTLQYGRTPFFLSVHFFDPHTPWKRDLEREQQERRGLTAPFKVTDEAAVPPPRGMMAQQMYRKRIAWADREFGRLMECLKQSHLSPTTYVAVTADHGIAFREHGAFGYAFSLYNEVTRIPLMIRTPEDEVGRVSSPVSLIDLGPTLLDLMGVTDKHGDGVSFRRLLEAQAAEGGRPVYAETVALPSDLAPKYVTNNELSRFGVGIENIQSALVVDNFKLIYIPTRRGQKYELYDLIADPTEQRDAFDPHKPVDARRVDQLLAMRRAATGREAGVAGNVRDRADLMERLRALGYVE